MKIAIVKSTRYNDLWATKTSDPFEVYKTTLMRCSQIGLVEFFDTDYIIVKESFEYPCQEIIYGWEINNRHSMRYNKRGKHTDLPFLDESYHNDICLEDISHNVDDIDWGKYNIIITINACVPQRVTQKFPAILWSYYVSENDDNKTNKLLGGYNLLLNQDVMKPMREYEIGFPYSFCGPSSVERIGRKIEMSMGGSAIRNGIFIEINNSTQRPFITPPSEFIKIANETQLTLLLHNQNVLLNCFILCKSKYYVKLFGRVIRGNGILEGISAGTLLLMNKDLVMYNDLICDECHVQNENDVIRKIKQFEKDPDLYKRILEKQKSYFTKNYVENPISALVSFYEKRLKNK